MKLKNVTVDSMDLTFDIPTPGVSICVFEEGISKMTNEKSGKTTLRLPLSIAEVVEGDQANEGRKFSHFIPIETNFGEKQVQGILSMTGLLESFVNRFQGDIDPLEDVFIIALQTKLPGKTIKVAHELRKDQKGKDQVGVLRFEKIGKPAHASPKGATGKATQVQAIQTKAKIDW